MKVGQIYREKMATTLGDGVAKKSNTFLVSFRGISTAKMNVLRKDLKRKKADVVVAKTTLTRLALKQARFEDLAGHAAGQTALVLSDTDASEVSKILVKFAKDFEGFVVQGGLLNGSMLNAEQVKTLSDLPSREVLLAKFIGTVQAPLTRLVSGMNAKSRDLVSILKQLSEKGGQ